MKTLFFSVFLAFIAIFAAVVLAEDCPNKCLSDVRYYDGYFSAGYCQYRTEDCNVLDKEYGSRFCKNDDLYIQYKNYYCTPGSCKYEMYDQKTEECGSGGCNNGYCMISCDTECDTRDGFYGDSFCSGKSVLQHYRDYYCSGYVCHYVESDRSVEYCPEGCSNGVCKGISCPSKCENDVWNYGGNIISGKCVYQKTDCSASDKETGSRYCKNNAVYTKFIDYYCSDGCKSVVYERKAEDCKDKCTSGNWYNLDENTMEKRDDCYSYSCTSGKCVQSKTYTTISRQEVSKTLQDIAKEKSLQFNINVSSAVIQKNFTHADTVLFNGLFFGSNEAAIELPESAIGYISFYVNSTNNYAPLVISLNNETYQISGLGEHKLLVNKSVDHAVIIIRSESSLWRFWTPAKYDIRNIVVSARAADVKKDEFDFIIENNEYENFVKAQITEWPKNTSVFINDKIISEGFIEKAIFAEGRNAIMFVPWPNATSAEKGILNLWYTEKAMI